MQRIRISKNFYLDELVDVITYVTEPDHGLSKLDPIIVDCLQLLRTLHGKPIIVNNWWGHWCKNNNAVQPLDSIAFYDLVNNQNGIYQSSGYRAPWCKIGAKQSAHRKGKAVDPKGNQIVLQRIITDNAKLFYDLGLRRLEDVNITKGWLHMDTSERNHNKNRIRVIGLESHIKDIFIE